MFRVFLRDTLCVGFQDLCVCSAAVSTRFWLRICECMNAGKQKSMLSSEVNLTIGWNVQSDHAWWQVAKLSLLGDRNRQVSVDISGNTTKLWSSEGFLFSSSTAVGDP